MKVLDPTDTPTAAELDFDQRVMRSPERVVSAWEAFRSEMLSHKILFDGRLLPTCLKPHFVAQTLHDGWNAKCTSFLAALERVGKTFVETPELRRQLGLPSEAENLLAIDPGYPMLAVACRPDVLCHGGQPYIVEVNTDSAAMMTFADWIEENVARCYPLVETSKQWSIVSNRRTTALLEALLSCYREWGGTKSDPTIAIVDWSDVKTRDEQQLTARMFSQLGFPSFVCDPRELSCRGGRLYAGDRAIDIVQRRVLFPEFLSRADELQSLLQAYREHGVCVVNPLRSYILGNKVLLALLSSGELDSILSQEERTLVREIIPETRLLTPAMCRTLIHDRSEWVIKDAFGHGGDGVVIGQYVTQDAWRDALTKSERPRIVQKFKSIPVYRLPVFQNATAAVELEPRYINWNPFFFGGKVAGGISRASGSPVVSITARGALLPTVAV